VEKAGDIADHVGLAQQLQQWQAELAQVLVLAPSEADDPGDDRLVGCREGACEIGSCYQTVWRWADENPEALGVRRVGSKVLISLRKLKFFAHRRRSKF
jgi:hypothetical protein